MVSVKEDKDMYLPSATGGGRYISHFERLEKRARGSGRAWLLPIRKAAMARFTELGFPTTRHEEWRYTNVKPIADTAFEPGVADSGQIGREQVEALLFGDAGGSDDPALRCAQDRLLVVFVNGHFAPRLSTVGPQRNGVKVGSLAEFVESDSESVAPHLARHAVYGEHAFTALNTALMEDGAFVYIPKGQVVEEPIYLLFISSATGGVGHRFETGATDVAPLVSHPRNLIVLETNSQATIVESYVALGSNKYFTNAVTEIVVGENAVVDHYKIERESHEAFHIATLQLHQSAYSNVTSHTVSLGGRLVRNDINTVLDGEGCECTLNGLYLVTGTQHIDNHLVVEHAKPHCNSREFFKGIIDGRGKGIFSGRIIVHEGAQKTDAKQTNKSLLLSEDAQVESKPQLEIFADDVKCTHGATIGQISEEAIFYLRARGVREEAARRMLVFAFARECVERIRVAPLAAVIDRWVVERISNGQPLTETV